MIGTKEVVDKWCSGFQFDENRKPNFDYFKIKFCHFDHMILRMESKVVIGFKIKRLNGLESKDRFRMKSLVDCSIV